MAQPSHVELGIGQRALQDTPTPVARSWSPDRPGEITSPDRSPSMTGPDAGWALTLVNRSRLGDHKRGDSLRPIVARLATARAAAMGRGPIVDDVEAALILTGIDDRLSSSKTKALANRLIAQAAHEPTSGTAWLQSIPPDVLTGDLKKAHRWISTQLPDSE